MMRVKILNGNKKNCIKEISEDDALELYSLGEVEILDDVVDACAAKTAEGLPCKLSPAEDSIYCWRHARKEE